MKKIFKKIAIFLLLILIESMIFSCLMACYNFARAEIQTDSTYTNVLDDLQKDSSFNASNYPVNNKDFSLQVIQIAESEDKELFVYVYQPCANINVLATSINIAIDNTINFVNYELSLISSKGVFFKYKIKNFIVNDNIVRSYEITGIYRLFDKNIDKGLDNDNVVNEVVYNVSKIWTITTNGNGETTTILQDVETIKITSKYVGFVRYLGSTYWGSSEHCDSHFVAFSTNTPIEKLLEADVYFKKQTANCYNTQTSGDLSWAFGQIKDEYSYITSQDIAHYETSGSSWSHYSYDWQRIQTSADFIAGEDFSKVYNCAVFNEKVQYTLNESAKVDLADKQWVLRFYESAFNDNLNWFGIDYSWTNVSNVSVLRLKFETDGAVYNLGVVDNKQTGSGVPNNTITVTREWKFELILNLLLLIILIVIFAPILPTIISLAITLIKILLKVALWLISLPFKILNLIFNKRGRKSG